MIAIPHFIIMGIIQSVTQFFKPVNSSYSISSVEVKEALKGEVLRKEPLFSKDLGEEHPFNFSDAEGLYLKFPLLAGAIDKYVEYIVGPGFFVKSEDAKAQAIIENFLREINFDHHLRKWFKEALIKGNGFMELGFNKNGTIDALHVLDSKWMFIKRDNKGNVESYQQLKFSKRGSLNVGLRKDDFLEFSPRQIAHFAINVLGDCAYGYGKVFPLMITINHYLQAQKDMHMILSRKAGAPYWFKVGDLDKGINPTQDVLNALRAELEVLTNRHEWVTSADIDIKAVDFGNFTQKFMDVLKSDEDQMFFGLQVPESIMGRGNIPEGLATSQKEGFIQNTITSLQMEAEKVIETNIFKPILNAQGLDVHVEFEWGQPDQAQREKRVLQLMQIISSGFTSPGMKQAAEKDLIEQMGFDELEIQEANEEAQAMMDEETKIGDQEKEDEKKEKQPLVPGQRPSKGREFLNSSAKKRKFYESFPIDSPQSPQDYALKEWLNFNYKDYVNAILQAIDDDSFDALRANTQQEIREGYLTDPQIARLKLVLADGIRKEKSMREITRDIEIKIGIKDLLRFEKGEPKIILPKDARTSAIARTEITRLSNIGLLDHYEATGSTKVRFLATLSARTCPICESFNGMVFDIEESYDIIPEETHANCRCSWVVVT